MNWVENILILAGVSLDLFAAMECQGSLVAKVNKKQLSGICVLVALCQVFALFIGHLLSTLYCRRELAPDEQVLGEVISMIIFVGLGIRLLIKAVLNERIEEHLETNLGMKRFVRMASVSSIYTLLAGIAFGFLGTNLTVILIMIVVFTIAFVVGGMYTGYHWGFASKTAVYIIGAVLLWGAGLDVLIRRVL